MSSTFRREAAKHRRTATRYDRKFEGNAQMAAAVYADARSLRVHAAWVAGLDAALAAMQGATPADWERQAAERLRFADCTLEFAFHCARTADFYRDLGDQYVAMARNQESRLAS